MTNRELYIEYVIRPIEKFQHRLIEEYEKQDLIIINIVIDTSEIKFIRTKDIYYYFTGYLYERICKIMRKEKAIANINISSRSNLNKNDLVNFLKSHNDKHQIEYDKIGEIKIYPNAQKRMLQIADCCCSCLGQALKYDNQLVCSLYKPLIKKLYKEKGHFISNGLKFVPPGSKPDNLKFLDRSTNKKSVIKNR